MNMINILLLLFLLVSFTVGISITDEDLTRVDGIINNASITISNITLESPESETIPNIEGFFHVLENYIHFIGSLMFEVMRAGIHFGYDNPNYFEPDFIIGIVKLIVIAIIVSLLIKPAFYVLIFLVMGVIYLKDKMTLRKKKNAK